MRHYQNIRINKISWLKINDLQGGVINNLYYPESIEEFIDIVRFCHNNNQKYYVFGHTSNSYFLPSFSPNVVISVIELKGFTETYNSITVECGMHTKVLARMMVENGYVGFEGLVDLPGTVSGAVYGNAGCYGCLISDRLVSVRILTSSGEILDYTKDRLGFQERSSSLKNGQIQGTILTVTFEKVNGDKEESRRKAVYAHKHRLMTQPGPVNNLGSIFKNSTPTRYGNWIRRIGKYSAKFLRLPENDHKILKLKLLLCGYPALAKYLFDLNRFIWTDDNAHKAFDDYLNLRNKLYKHNDFEIEVFK